MLTEAAKKISKDMLSEAAKNFPIVHSCSFVNCPSFEDFKGRFDFVYLPIDFKNKSLGEKSQQIMSNHQGNVSYIYYFHLFALSVSVSRQ